MMRGTDEQAAPKNRENWDIVVIGAGQAGLAASYYLRRTPWSWMVLDGEIAPGAAWRHGWDSLRLFSPAEWSSLPGWPMPARADGTPTRDDVLDYFAAYETRNRGVLQSVQPFVTFTPHGVVWADGRQTIVDAVIWCTGFCPALDHLAPLGVIDQDGHVALQGTRAVAEPRLWLVGYGE